MVDFKITPNEARQEIGDKGIAELEALYAKVYGGRLHEFTFRYAPSIVTRGEVELFDMSMPRFAVRTYLDPDGGSFVNARRIRRFAGLAPRRWAQRKRSNNWRQCPLRVQLDEAATLDTPEQLIIKSSCIADSLLTAPKELLDEYHILQAELGRAYGEGRDVIGTPFVKHIQYAGGGLCAQAVCFMASALLHQFPLYARQRWSGVHSVAEITAIVAEPDDNELPLKGLRWDQMPLYFTKTGRFARAQMPQVRNDAVSEQELFGVALRAYISSGMPVILPANIGTLIRDRGLRRYSESVYARNRLLEKPPNRHKAEPVHNHAILLIGCSRRNSEEFLINDPAAYPYMKASLRQLWRCGLFVRKPGLAGTSSWRTVLGGILESISHGVGMDWGLASGRFIPITPNEVKVSLECWIEKKQRHEKGKWYAGLTRIAQIVQQEGGRLPDGHAFCSDVSLFRRPPGEVKYNPGEFRLIRLRTDDLVKLPDHWTSLVRQLVEGLDKRFNDHWCWLQALPAERGSGRPATLWLWDAEKTVHLLHHQAPKAFTTEQTMECMDMLLGLADLSSNRWLRTRSPDGKERGPGVAAPVDGAHGERISIVPKPSLISSFTVEGFKSAARTWPERIPCELYAFMHKDMVELQNSIGVGGDDNCGTAIRQMELWSKSKRSAHSVAEAAIQAFGSSAGIVALATFLPEITSPDKEAAAIPAMRFLMHLARELKVLQEATRESQRVFVVELVGGSLIEGIWPAIAKQLVRSGLFHHRMIPRNDIWYIANRRSVDEAIRYLCDNLQKAILDTPVADRNSGIVLALELEPGPLFILNSLPRLSKVCSLLEHKRYETLARVLGFNLDVAHYSLCGGNPEIVWNTPGVRDRIVHAHISDVGHGHFSDAALGEVGLGMVHNADQRISVFKPWLELIGRVAAVSRAPDRPPFSGFVSVELEACKNVELVRLSSDRLRGLLDEVGSA